MANRLYESMGSKTANPYAEIIAGAQELRKKIMGNPRDMVQELLNSGQMSQADFNRYSQIAQQIVQYVSRK